MSVRRLSYDLVLLLPGIALMEGAWLWGGDAVLCGQPVGNSGLMVRGGLAEHADRLVLIGLCRRGETVRARVRQSTLNGMLLAPQHLRTADEAARPTLNPWAAARATILALCDGAQSLTIENFAAAASDIARVADASGIEIAGWNSRREP